MRGKGPRNSGAFSFDRGGGVLYTTRMDKNTQTDTNPTAVFMMGGPGSGKSYIANQRYTDLLTLDCDSIKAEHPDYDPKNPSALHEWSRQELASRLYATMADRQDFLYDGTGASAERYVQYIRQAQDLGYTVTLCYVRCSLRTALERNANRERVVPEWVVRDRHSTIATSFEIVSTVADNIVVVDNN